MIRPIDVTQDMIEALRKAQEWANRMADYDTAHQMLLIRKWLEK